MELAYSKRTCKTTLLKEIQDENGNWKRSGEKIVLTINDNFYKNPETGETLPVAIAFDLEEDETKPIEGTEPVEYEKVKVLKEGFVNEVDLMYKSNQELIAVISSSIKTKVPNLYE